MKSACMYSKKAMNYFKNPKFTGEIKNADAIATVGNIQCGDVLKFFLKIKKNKIIDIKFKTYGCLPKNEKVLINHGDWEDISKIDKRQNLLNSNGWQTQVIKTYKRKYRGPMLNIIPFVSPYNSFELTPTHPILAIKRNMVKECRKRGRSSDILGINKKNLLTTEPGFFEAWMLEKGDYLIYNVNRKIKDDNKFTKDIMRLLGYYLSEGYIVANGGMVAFAFHKNEKEYIQEVKDLIYKILKKEASQRIRSNVCEVYISSRKFVKFLVSNAGKMAKNKKVSDEILTLPFEKQIQMLETYMRGDGNSHRRRPHNNLRYRVNTASEKLAIQIQEMLARGGIFSSIKKVYKKETYIEGRKIKASIQYEISYQLERKNQFVHIHDNYFLVPIRRIESRDFNGNVYNLEVKDNPHTYLVKGFAVHNCVAAIASSEALARMAKGKTLTQALKIKDADIIKHLGSLPSIKFHCSVLGVAVLKKAIENYKKTNKD